MEQNGDEGPLRYREIPPQNQRQNISPAYNPIHLFHFQRSFPISNFFFPHHFTFHPCIPAVNEIRPLLIARIFSLLFFYASDEKLRNESVTTIGIVQMVFTFERSRRSKAIKFQIKEKRYPIILLPI